MFKNKGFLYGLGLGLILGASLLQLMNFTVITGKALNDTTISASPTPGPTVKPVLTPNTSLNSPKVSAAITPASPDSLLPVKPDVNKTIVPATPKPADTVKGSSAVEVIIEEGMNSTQVAALLYNRGIITDRSAFDDALGHLKLDRTIHYGTYSFDTGENMQDIINKITWQKK